MEGEWKQRRGKALGHWGKVMNDDLAAIAGKYEEFVGKLQERHGIAKEEVAHEIKEFKETIKRLKKSNKRLIQLQKSTRAGQNLKKKRAVTGNTLEKKVRAK